MKYFLSILVLLVSLNADEMQRIESILNDIVELRSNYEDCKASLQDKELGEYSKDSDSLLTEVNLCVEKDEQIQNFKRLYTNEKSKNNVLNTKLNIYSGMNQDKKDIEIEKYKKLLKIKEYEFLQLKKQMKNMKKTELKTVCKVIELESSDNVFPKLKLKKKYANTQKKKIYTKIKPKQNETIINFKAATFVLKSDSVIYNSINGNKLYTWEEGSTFTSNIKTQSYIKITGYFEKRKWLPAKEEMWIKLSNVSKK